MTIWIVNQHKDGTHEFLWIQSSMKINPYPKKIEMHYSNFNNNSIARVLYDTIKIFSTGYKYVFCLLTNHNCRVIKRLSLINCDRCHILLYFVFCNSIILSCEFAIMFAMSLYLQAVVSV